jgi:hypothetical protein
MKWVVGIVGPIREMGRPKLTLVSSTPTRQKAGPYASTPEVIEDELFDDQMRETPPPRRVDQAAPLPAEPPDYEGVGSFRWSNTPPDPMVRPPQGASGPKRPRPRSNRALQLMLVGLAGCLVGLVAAMVGMSLDKPSVQPAAPHRAAAAWMEAPPPPDPTFSFTITTPTFVIAPPDVTEREAPPSKEGRQRQAPRPEPRPAPVAPKPASVAPTKAKEGLGSLFGDEAAAAPITSQKTSLSVDDLVRTATARAREIKPCLLQAYDRHELAASEPSVDVSFTVALAGAVTAIRLERAAGLSNLAQGCIVNVISHWRFAPGASPVALRNVTLGPIKVP